MTHVSFTQALTNFNNTVNSLMQRRNSLRATTLLPSRCADAIQLLLHKLRKLGLLVASSARRSNPAGDGAAAGAASSSATLASRNEGRALAAKLGAGLGLG